MFAIMLGVELHYQECTGYEIEHWVFAFCHRRVAPTDWGPLRRTGWDGMTSAFPE